ncbi:methionyl-tRNA formyltransferase, partial [Candidatus Saccharibacteria bacterium]
MTGSWRKFPMNKSKRLVFFGNERLSSGFTPAREDSALQALIANGYDIAAVIAHHGGGTSRSKRELEIESIAKEYEIPVLLPNKPTDIEDELRSFNADAAVLIAYGRIIPERIINLFPRGIINIHPSLLPMYRGPIPIEQAILDGAPKTGVSVMALTKEMDAGPVYVQAEVLLSGDETKFELTRRLFAQGSSLLIQHLP